METDWSYLQGIIEDPTHSMHSRESFQAMLKNNNLPSHLLANLADLSEFHIGQKTLTNIVMHKNADTAVYEKVAGKFTRESTLDLGSLIHEENIHGEFLEAAIKKAYLPRPFLKAIINHNNITSSGLADAAAHSQINDELLLSIAEHDKADDHARSVVVNNKKATTDALTSVAMNTADKALLEKIIADNRSNGTTLTAILNNVHMQPESVEGLFAPTFDNKTRQASTSTANAIDDVLLAENNRSNRGKYAAILYYEHIQPAERESIFSAIIDQAPAGSLAALATNTINTAFLKKLAADERSNEDVFTAILNNKNAPAATLGILARVATSNAFLEKLASNHRSDDTVFADIVDNINAQASTLGIVAAKATNGALLKKLTEDERSNEDTYAAILGNPNAQTNTLNILAAKTADDAILKALAGGEQSTEETRKNIAKNPAATAKILIIAAGKSKDPNTLDSIAQHDKADGDTLHAVTINPLAQNNTLIHISGHQNLTYETLKQLSKKGSKEIQDAAHKRKMDNIKALAGCGNQASKLPVV